MIVRGYIKCLTCNHPHMPRVQVGIEPTQSHTFKCQNCNESIRLSLEINPKTLESKIIPFVIYTPLQIAYAGLTEENAKEIGLPYKVKKILISSLAKQKIKLNTRSYLKCIVNDKYEMIGVEIVSSEASELIATCLVIMENKIDCRDIHKIIYAHPSLNEVFRDLQFEY